MNFSYTLKTLREQKHVTQKQLAAHLNISRATISGYESKSHQPDFDTLERIADYFEVSLDFLISGQPRRGIDENIQTKILESALEQEIKSSLPQLSLASKKEVLKYIQLLQLRDTCPEDVETDR